VLASKLGVYLELPRETARRKLDTLVKFGLLRQEGRRYFPTERTLATDARVLEHIDHITHMVRHFAAAL